MLGACGAGDPEDAGRRIYRDGILANGEPLTALVAGDVPVLGTQFSCQSCHGRSGMGATEGSYIVPPIAGPFLFEPSPQPERPAYDLASLAAVLRDGVTPAGRVLEPLMPRYRLENEDLEALAVYLETLSAGDAPGIDASVIRFATVFAGDVDAGERDAVLAVLRRFFEEKNRQTRLESERWDRGYTPESRLPTVFREWVLDAWDVSGPTGSWGDQLETYYREAPAFALLSGLGASTWAPVGRFCERHEIPCLFPGVDLTERDDDDFYTLYFSRGLELEANLIAMHTDAVAPQRILQVYCAPGFDESASQLAGSLGANGASVIDVPLDCESDSMSEVADMAARGDSASPLVLWLSAAQLSNLDLPLPAERVYLSSTLLGNAADLPAALASGPVYAAHPYRRPGDADPAMRRFEVWAKTRNIEVSHPRRQAEAFFAVLAASDSVKHMGRFFIRDYILDMLDHAQGMAGYVPVHPRPTLGPGQRFLNKGGYVIPAAEGSLRSDEAEWLQP